MSSAGLSGNLSDFGIADVFQLIGQQRKTGTLELRTATARAQLSFDRGLVVTAGMMASREGDLDPLADRLMRCGYLTRTRAEEAIAASRASAQTLARTLVDRGWLDSFAVKQALDLVTRDAIFEVLRWQSGSFDFHAQPIEHNRDPAELLGAEQILMDGLRMVDEWQSFSAQVPSEGCVFERVGGFERYAEQPNHSDAERANAERVFSHVDGRLSARRVVDLARLGTFDGMRALSELVIAGAIERTAARAEEPLRRPVRVAREGWLALRSSAMALVPLAALAAVAWWTATSSASPANEPDRPIVRSTLSSLREDYAARAVRHALEAYRLTHGRWPARLEDLVNSGLLPPEALATRGGRSYYQTHRDLGPIFLAPERS
jgi:Domain of unknown function (DUF4388)